MNFENDLLVINVLAPEYFDDCAIKGSISVPLEELEDFVESKDRDINVVVYCANPRCTASDSAWRKLSNLGFNHVWAYKGGISEWFQAGLPVIGSCSKPYLFEKTEKMAFAESNEVHSISLEDLKEFMEKKELL